MPADQHSNEPHQQPRADDEVRAKRDLWALAKEAAIAQRQATAPAPTAEPAAPVLRRRIKLRKPPIAAQPAVEQEPVAYDLPVEEPSEPEPVVEPIAAAEVENLSPVPEAPEPIKAEVTQKAAPVAEQEPPTSTDQPAREDKATAEAAADAPASADKPGTEEKGQNKEKPTDPNLPKAEDAPSATQERFRRTWENIGGRYLTMSILIHLGIILVAAFVYLSYTQDERIDFLPGGGTQQGDAASKSLENQVNRKKTRWLNKSPMQRIAVDKAMSAITLPEARPDLLDLPMSKDFMDAGKLGSFGFGKAGAGGGFGSGIGVGGKSGVTFTPLSMFGKKIVGKRIAVILDVSRSMTGYLENVVKELDRVAPGSPVILYCGCGVKKPDEVIMERLGRTQSTHFEVYWRIWQGEIIMTSNEKFDPDRVKIDRNIPISEPDVFRFFNRRNQTWFVYDHTLDYTWIALLSNEVRNADTLYWFSDFEDPVDAYQLKTVLDNMLVRRQRLYIHPQMHGSSFKQVVNELVMPSGGDVIEPDDGKKKKK
jgi:hypothetical protein